MFFFVKFKIEGICGDNFDLFVGNIFDNKFNLDMFC